MTLATAIVALVAAAVAAVVAGLTARALVARRVSRAAAALDPELPAVPTTSVDEAVGRMERAVTRARDESRTGIEAAVHLQAAADALPIGLVVADAAEQVLLQNSVAERFSGARHADALVDEAVRLSIRAALRGEPVAQTLELYGPPRRTVTVRSVPVSGSDLAVALIEDVTERTHLEAMRTDFVANISHELRTPVGALALLAETMVGEDDPAVLGRLADKVGAEAHRVGRIIEDLLELSRLEHAGRPQLEVVEVKLIVAEAVERVRLLATQREISVTVEEPSHRLTVVGDRRQLVSALANLIENGIKYSDRGSVVEISTRSDGTTVDLVVTDHGIGIPVRDQERIFERFYRVDRARSRETGGTGLGLAIVRHVATNHGGTVSVTSAEGQGSTFRVTIPAGPGPHAVTLPEAG